MLWGIQNQLRFYFASTFGLTSPSALCVPQITKSQKKSWYKVDGGKGFDLPNISQGGLTKPQQYKYFKRNTIYLIFIMVAFKTSFFCWQDSQAATAEGLTFSDPIHKKKCEKKKWQRYHPLYTSLLL
jgi:hypothetical protein